MIRPIGQDTTRITIDVDSQFMKLLSTARETKGTPNVGIRELLQLALKDCSPETTPHSTNQPAPVQPTSSNPVRGIPVPIIIQLGNPEKPKKTLLN
jgi:hypothetical protein